MGRATKRSPSRAATLLSLLVVVAVGCAGPSPAATATLQQKTPQEAIAIRQAQMYVATALNLDASQVQVAEHEAAQWPDTCLGIQVPGQPCVTQIVGGYRVILEADGQRIPVRTNLDGNQVAAEMALTWHREGGIGGFCDDLAMDTIGRATAFSCGESGAHVIASVLLNPEPRQQLYEWLNSWEPFELDRTDAATADAMTIQLHFFGQGDQVAPEATRQEIEAFAAQFFAQISSSGVTPGPSPTPTAAEAVKAAVADLLKSIMADPSGQASRFYLAEPLRSATKSGKEVLILLGLEGPLRSFHVGSVQLSPDGEWAYAEATLDGTGPFRRAFQLVMEDGAWKVATFIAYEVPASNLAPDLAQADGAILAFFRALANQQPAVADKLLTPKALGESDVDGLAQGSAGLHLVSAHLTDALGDTMIYSLQLWVSPGAAGSGPWEEGQNTRWLELLRTHEGWRINGMTKAKITT